MSNCYCCLAGVRYTHIKHCTCASTLNVCLPLQVLPELDSLELSSCVLREAPVRYEEQLLVNETDAALVSAATCAEFPEMHRSQSLVLDCKQYSYEAALAAMGMCVRYTRCSPETPEVRAVTIKNFNCTLSKFTGQVEVVVDVLGRTLRKIPSVRLQSFRTDEARFFGLIKALESNKQLHTLYIESVLCTRIKEGKSRIPGGPLTIYSMLESTKARLRSLTIRSIVNDGPATKQMVSVLPKLTCLTHLQIDRAFTNANDLTFVSKLTKLKSLSIWYYTTDKGADKAIMAAIGRLTALSSLSMERYNATADRCRNDVSVLGQSVDPRQLPAALAVVVKCLPKLSRFEMGGDAGEIAPEEASLLWPNLKKMRNVECFSLKVGYTPPVVKLSVYAVSSNVPHVSVSELFQRHRIENCVSEYSL